MIRPHSPLQMFDSIVKNLRHYLEYLPWMIGGVLITACTHGVIYWLHKTEETHIFVHIPKTGGTALNQWIDQQHLLNQCTKIRSAHTHYLDAQHAVRLGYRPITIIRHPIERFVSSFYYWKYGSKDITAWQRAPHWNKADGINSPDDLVAILKNPKHPKHAHITKSLFSRDAFTHRHHFLPQSLWLTAHEHKAIIICYHASQLTQNIQAAFQKHGINCPVDKLPVINQSVSPAEKTTLSTSSQQWLSMIYADDLTLWSTHCEPQIATNT